MKQDERPAVAGGVDVRADFYAADDTSSPGEPRRRWNIEVRLSSLEPVPTRQGQRTPIGVEWIRNGSGLFTMVYRGESSVMVLYPHVVYTTASGRRYRLPAREWPGVTTARLPSGQAGRVVLPDGRVL